MAKQEQAKEENKEPAVTTEGPEGTTPAVDEAAADDTAKPQTVVTGEVPWTVVLERKLGRGWANFGEIVGGVFSRDRHLRRMSFLFLVGCFGVFSVLYQGWSHYHIVSANRGLASEKKAESDDQASNLSKLIAREAESAHYKHSTLSLGTFLIELKRTPGSIAVPGVLDTAEIEVTVLCNEKATCGALEERLPQARDRVVDVITALDREELMSFSGKRRLKKQITRSLNLWLPQGEIESVYFTKLTID